MLGWHDNHNTDIVSVFIALIISKNFISFMSNYYGPGVLHTRSLKLLTTIQSSYDISIVQGKNFSSQQVSSGPRIA